MGFCVRWPSHLGRNYLFMFHLGRKAHMQTATPQLVFNHLYLKYACVSGVGVLAFHKPRFNNELMNKKLKAWGRYYLFELILQMFETSTVSREKKHMPINAQCPFTKIRPSISLNIQIVAKMYSINVQDYIRKNPTKLSVTSLSIFGAYLAACLLSNFACYCFC